MELSKSRLSIANLLALMEGQEPEAVQLNHVVIEANGSNLPTHGSLEQLPSFTAQFAGFVDVELYMDMHHERVVHLRVRQSAMTFAELEENGDVLPNLSIDCQVLEDSERARLDVLARRYIKDGKINDQSRGEALLTQYVAKAMFCSRKYGGMTHA